MDSSMYMDPSTTSSYSTPADSAATAVGAVFGVIFMIIYLVVLVLLIVSLWKLFTKAGKPGWAAIIPIYNSVVMCEIAGRPLWWVVLLFIPLVNIVVGAILGLEFVRAYGKDTAFQVLSIFFPYVIYPIMGFSKNTKYVGPKPLF